MAGQDRFAGDVVETLADGMLLTCGPCFIGAVAFECCPGILGGSLSEHRCASGRCRFCKFRRNGGVASHLFLIPCELSMLNQADRARVTACGTVSCSRVEFLPGKRASAFHPRQGDKVVMLRELSVDIKMNQAAKTRETVYAAGFAGSVEGTFPEKTIPGFEAKSGV